MVRLEDFHPGLPHLRATAQLKESSGPVALVLEWENPDGKNGGLSRWNAVGKPGQFFKAVDCCVIRSLFCFFGLGGFKMNSNETHSQISQATCKSISLWIYLYKVISTNQKSIRLKKLASSIPQANKNPQKKWGLSLLWLKEKTILGA